MIQIQDGNIRWENKMWLKDTDTNEQNDTNTICE